MLKYRYAGSEETQHGPCSMLLLFYARINVIIDCEFSLIFSYEVNLGRG
jgi:hypothetical protein